MASREVEHDGAVLIVLRARDGRPTLVTLRDGRELTVLDSAWGYDDGDASAHVTTNISPVDGSLRVDDDITDAAVSLTARQRGMRVITSDPHDLRRIDNRLDVVTI